MNSPTLFAPVPRRPLLQLAPQGKSLANTRPTANPAQPTYGCVLACATGTHANIDSTLCEPDDGCPLPYLEPLPTAASDPCTAALHRRPYSQAAVDKVCGVPSANTQKEVACLAEKLKDNGITMQINNKVRSQAYQAHFWDVWSKMKAVMEGNIQNDPVKKAACAARQLELAKEKGCDGANRCVVNKKPHCPLGGHCFASAPSENPKSAHSERRAIDISGTQVNTLEAWLNAQKPPQSMKQFLTAPSSKIGTVCPAAPQLKWGGKFNGNPDRVHFYLDKP